MFSVKRDNLIFQIYWASQVKILIDLTEHLNNKNFSLIQHPIKWVEETCKWDIRIVEF